MNGLEIIFNENDYENLFINFSWEESIDLNEDDEVLYSIVVTNENTSENVLELSEYTQETLPVPLTFIIDDIDDLITNDEILFSWKVIAKDNEDEDLAYTTECNQTFEFTLIFESLGNDDLLIPEFYELGDSYPNPFNPVTTIEYGLPESSFIELSVYDIHGKLVQTLESGNKIAGYHSIVWNAQNMPTGTYFIRMITPQFVATRKVSLIK